MSISITAKSAYTCLPLILFSLSCRTRTYHADANLHATFNPQECLAQAQDSKLTIIGTGTVKTSTWHWNSDRRMAEVPYAQRSFSNSLMALQGKDPSQDPNAMGAGIYVAADPGISAAYGRVLVEVPIKPSCQLGFTPHHFIENDSDKTLIQSGLPGIVYNFAEPGRAIVIRNPSVILFDEIRTYDTFKNDGKRLNEVESFAGEADWRMALQHYGALYPIMFANGVKEMMAKPFFDGTGKSTDYGIALAIAIEITNPTADILKTLKTAIETDKTSYPMCSQTEAAMTMRGIPNWLCLNLSSMKSLGSLIGTGAGKKIQLPEAIRILKISRALPQDWPDSSTQEATEAMLVKQARQRIPENKAAAWLKSVEYLSALLQEPSIENWPAPAPH